MAYLLDTNIMSHLMKSNRNVWQHLLNANTDDVSISAVTFAEIGFGLAKNPQAVKQQKVFDELLKLIDVQPFDKQTAQDYGIFKAKMQQSGKNLHALDCMIAAHAHSLQAILVTNDQAFFQIDGLNVEDWTR